MQYCLSQGSYSENKSLIFVKLTDSALRAIGELTKSRNNSSFYPTIHFQGNQGVISLPRPQATNSESCQKFGFNLSNVEAEGPQGSFECIRQTGSGSLQSLGCMVHKMHIHANEESYEKTRVKMATVEKERKKDCTKEIKASGPYVRRKVKVKRPMSSLISASNNAPSPSSLAPVPRPIPKMTNYSGTSASNLGNSSTNGGSSSVASSSHFRPSSSSVTSVPTASPGLLSASSSSQQVAGGCSSSSSSGGSLAPTGPTPPSAPPPAPAARVQHGNPDIMRRSYRERVIHLLALRPYKKPELLARLMKDGIKEKDKKGLSAMLSKVAQAKDNTYSLARYCWSEVAEDWPFYTHEERELLKRRKPQNATPPNETDHPSPTAIHSSQSPPFFNSQSQKRPPSLLQPDYNNVQQPKKQRISHYITNGSSSNSVSAGGTSSNSSSNGTYTLSNRLADPSVLTLCTSSNKQMENNASGGGRKVESPTTAHPNPWTNRNRTDGRSPNPATAASDNSARTPNNLQQRSQTPTNLRNPETFAPTSQSQRRSPPPPTSQSRLANNSSKPSRNSENNNGLSNHSSSEWNASSRQTSSLKSPPPSRLLSSSAARESKYPGGGTGANSTLSSSSAAKMGGRPRINPAAANTGSAGSRGSSPQSSPESQDSVEYRASSSLNSSPNSSEIPDYISKYVGITNRDQRAKYKADFNAEYNEYLKLHAIIEQVKRRFEALEDDLHGSTSGSPEWHRIRSQIVQEYEDNNRGHHYRDSKRRLNYLHDKLSHIKRLVVEYDQSVPAMQNAGGNNVNHHHQVRTGTHPSHQGHRVRVHHHSRGGHPQQRHHRQQVATA